MCHQDTQIDNLPGELCCAPGAIAPKKFKRGNKEAMPTAASYAPHQMGTLIIVAFPNVMKQLFNFLKPKPVQPTIESYAQQSCGVPQEEIQLVMEWLFASLMAAGYFGKSQIIWYNSDNPDPSLEQTVKKIVRSGEPIFLYRCGGRAMSLPQGYYWRIMEEHPSMRIYQLEVKDGE